MIEFELTLPDLMRTRFAISPVWELVSSLRLLHEPDQAALHLPWLRETIDAVDHLDLAPVLPLLRPRGYIPDFVTPPPSSPLVSFEDEIATVRATPDEQVLVDMDALVESGVDPSAVVPFREDTAGAVSWLCDTFEAYWEIAIEQHWPRVRALLESDLLYRSKRLTEHGPEGLFGDLHPCVRLAGENRVEVDNSCSSVVPLAGRGLLMVPSAFLWDCPATIIEDPWQPTLLYPARGIGLLWESPARAEQSEGLERVVGAARAKILRELDAPISTGGLAERIGITAGGASQHLSALKEARLVSATRKGRTVLHTRTELGDSMVRS